MKSISYKRESGKAFTLIELLVVIAIIAILASMSLVVIAKVRERGRETEARREIQALVNAIEKYHSDTGVYPVSPGVMSVAAASHKDFTYGGSALDAILGGAGVWSTNNSEIMAILLNLEKYPNTGAPTANFGHVKNSRQYRYLSDVQIMDDTNTPGLGPDLIYRDPWGNPYIISLDLNYDGMCQDALYQKSSVSQDVNNSGFNGLVNSTGAPDGFGHRGGVMVWSLGPDKKTDTSPATSGLNRDNILSWK